MRRTLFVILGTFIYLAASAHGATKQSLAVQGSLQSTGIRSNAAGKLELTIQPVKSELKIGLSGLAPSAPHTVVVDGVEQRAFTSSSSGKASLRFSQPPKQNSPALDFDPRGRLLSINEDTNIILFITIAGSNEPPNIRVAETVVLTRTPLAGNGKAVASFRIDKNHTTFKVEIEKLAAGAYQLAVDGIQRGVINVNSRHRGQIEFDSTPRPPEIALDFDPRGKVIDLTQDTNVFFTSLFLAPGRGVSVCSNSVREWPLISTGLDPDAHASARFRVRDNCRRDFQVEAEDLAPGGYDLVIGGVLRGVITVVDNAGDVQGELEFSTELDEDNELPLSFDPLTELIEIKQGTNVFFSGSGTPTAPGGTNCTPVSTELPLVNSGAIASAKGKARVRVDDDCNADFRVEIEDVPIGAYDLRIGGAVVGTIHVVNIGGENQGEIEFDTNPDEAGELPLTFDPRGQLIEVVQGGTVILNRTLP